MLNKPGNGVWTTMRSRVRAVAWVLAALCAPCGLAGIAQAQVFQTDLAKTPLPQPVGTAEMNLATQSFGYSAVTESTTDPLTGDLLATPLVYGQYYSPPAYPQFVDGDELTLAGLFKWRKEHIDPILDAKTAPGHFFPGCGFSAELVLRAGGCSSGLGWYNVKPGSTAPPAANEIYQLVPGDTAYLGASRTIFAPLGWDNRDPRSLAMLDWTPKSFSSGVITSNPNYQGGDIAFALVADPLSQCSQNKFSVYEHNIKNSSGIPWVTTLIYGSTVDPSGIYLAFEDLPMSAADWHQTGTPASQSTNDGDFNDFVFFVSGLGPTSTCPDPACVTVTCDAGSACSGGVCVPSASGAGGTGGGGAVNSGGDTSGGGRSAAGAPASSAGFGGSGTSPSAGSAGARPLGDGSGEASASGGASAITGTGGSATASTQITNGGSSCRIGGGRGTAHSSLLWLALGAAVAARRRRVQRLFARRALRAISSI